MAGTRGSRFHLTRPSQDSASGDLPVWCIRPVFWSSGSAEEVSAIQLRATKTGRMNPVVEPVKPPRRQDTPVPCHDSQEDGGSRPSPSHRRRVARRSEHLSRNEPTWRIVLRIKPPRRPPSRNEPTWRIVLRTRTDMGVTRSARNSGALRPGTSIMTMDRRASLLGNLQSSPVRAASRGPERTHRARRTRGKL
jgi:hypothetical protein